MLLKTSVKKVVSDTRSIEDISEDRFLEIAAELRMSIKRGNGYICMYGKACEGEGYLSVYWRKDSIDMAVRCHGPVVDEFKQLIGVR